MQLNADTLLDVIAEKTSIFKRFFKKTSKTFAKQLNSQPKIKPLF
jgi:hypothetical protein